MTNKFRLLFGTFLTIILTGTLLPANAQTARKPLTAAQNPLIQSLPASDAVISFNAQKFLTTALPQILGADSPKMAQINAQINAIKEQTGLDLYQFEQAAVGIKYKQVSATEIDFEPVILASGKLNAAGMIALVKIAVNGKYREEKSGDKTFYVLPVKDVFADIVQKQKTSSSVEKMMEKMLRTFSGEIAVGAISEKTLAIGSVARLQETFSGTAPISAELSAAANAKTNAVLNFGGRVPKGVSKMFGLDNEEIAIMLDSMKSVSGYMDMSGTNAVLNLSAKTTTVEEATILHDTITGLKELGKVFLTGAKGEEKAVYIRMIDNAVISRSGSQVKLNLLIAQSDLGILGKKL